MGIILNGISSMTPLESNGGVPVNPQDQATEIVGEWLSLKVGDTKSLTQATVLGQYTVNVTADHGIVANDEILIECPTKRFFGKVASVNVNELTLAQPLNYSFPIVGTEVREVNRNLNVNGAVTPVKFSFGLMATSKVSYHITGIRFKITDGTAMDDGTFGGIAELTRGVVLQIVSKGEIIRQMNITSNGMFSLLMDNSEYAAKAPSGLYGFSAMYNLKSDNGIVAKLEASDTIEVIVQDDLTNLTRFCVYAIGHQTMA